MTKKPLDIHPFSNFCNYKSVEAFLLEINTTFADIFTNIGATILQTSAPEITDFRHEKMEN